MKSNVTKHLSLRGTRVLVVVLSMLALTMGQKAWAIDYITDVMVIGHANKAEFDIMADDLRAYGWTPIDKDLNAGCGSGSDYIHLLYKTSSSNTSSEMPITDFYISNEYKASITYQGRTYYPVPYKGSSSFEDSHGDLNNNAGGDFIFLYYSEDSEGDNLGIDHVGIYRDNYFSTWLLKDTTGGNATVFGLDPLTLYEYQVRSIVNDYYSSWSDVMTFTTPETTPITTDGAELQDKVQSSNIKDQSESWFTIDGRKLNGKPKGKGVYIHNGKKAVVN